MIIVRAPAAPRGRESGFPASVGTPESVPASPAPAKAGGPRPSGLAACTGDPDSRPREAAGARTFIFRSGRCAQRCGCRKKPPASRPGERVRSRAEPQRSAQRPLRFFPKGLLVSYGN